MGRRHPLERQSGLISLRRPLPENTIQYIDTDCSPAASSNPLAGDAVLELETAAQRRVDRLAVVVARARIERLADGQTLDVRPTFVQRRRFELYRSKAGKEEGVVSSGCGYRAG
jgi:hypothetical protein